MLHFFHLARKIFQTFLEICVLCLFLFLSLLNLDSRATMLLFCSRRNSLHNQVILNCFDLQFYLQGYLLCLSFLNILGLHPLGYSSLRWLSRSVWFLSPVSVRHWNCLTCIHVATFKSLMQTNKQKTDQRHWLTQSFIFFLHMVHQTSLPCFSFLLCCLMKVTPPSYCFQKYWK